MWLATFCLVASLLSVLYLAQAVTEKAIVASRRDLTRVARAPADHLHEIMVVTKQRNQKQLEEIVLDISDPRSANYGKYLTRQEIASMTVEPGLPSKIVHALKDLCGNELESVVVESFGDYVIARAPVRTWERVLQAEFYHFDRSDHFGKPLKPIIRALEYTLPSSLLMLVQSIQNTVQFPSPERPEWNSPNQELDRLYGGNPSIQCPKNRFTNLQPPKKGIKKIMDGFVTPDLLTYYYNILPSDLVKPDKNLASQAMYESDQQNYSPDDLLMFQNTFSIYNKTVVRDYGHHNISKVCEKPPSPCGEANLDIQYMMAVSQFTPTSYISQMNGGNHTSAFGEDFWMVIFLRTLMNMTSPPLVNSVSYGSQEYQQSLSSILAFEDAAKKLAAMGRTVVISAGDDGVHDTNARAGSSGPRLCGYSASYPATSLWVVAVGAVQGPETGIPTAPSRAFHTPAVCSGSAGGVITGGGGFSDYIAMPDWQKDTVNNYFNKLKSWQKPAPGYAYQSGKYKNISGRAYPDLALLGYNYIVYQNKTPEGVSGTSASAPTFAAMVSLVNAARMATNQPSVGWITKLIWENHQTAFDPQGAYDVKVGHNKCTATSGSANVSDTCQIALVTTCCSQGFYATEGWDPASGFGGIDFQKFKSFFMSLKMPTLYPTASPTVRPTNPTAHPTAAPTHPTAAPTEVPTHPTTPPTVHPTAKPSTSMPSHVPTPHPTADPTSTPTVRPTPGPGEPTFKPTVQPTPRPSSAPSPAPTRPTAAPTVIPTARPSALPSTSPTALPTVPPSAAPTTSRPTPLPGHPTSMPTPNPSPAPSVKPTAAPTQPSPAPSAVPTVKETTKPSAVPSAVPTVAPSDAKPTSAPSPNPTSLKPSPAPSPAPTSSKPTSIPSPAPTVKIAAKAADAGRRKLQQQQQQQQENQSRVPTEIAILDPRRDIVQRERASPESLHEVIFAMRPRGLEELARIHTAVFEPDSDQYLQYPSPESIIALTTDPDNEVNVRQVLRAAGVSDKMMKSSSVGGHLYATAPVRIWEALFDTVFHVFDRLDQDGKFVPGRLVRAIDYVLPQSLQPYVSTALNTVQLPPPVTRRYRHQHIGAYSHSQSQETLEKQATQGVCVYPGGSPLCVVNGEIVVNPKMLNAVYSISSNVGFPCSYDASGKPQATITGYPYATCPQQPFNKTFGQAIFASLDQSFSTLDLLAFEEDTKSAVNLVFRDYGGHNLTVVNTPLGPVDACTLGLAQCGEANLDVQYMMGLSQYTPTYFIYQNATNTTANTLYVDFLKFVDSFSAAKGTTLPWVISISYGGPESLISKSELAEFEVLATKVLLRGSTVIVASGDDGANGYDSRTNVEGQYACGYTPDYPASSPSVTAVGALMGPDMGYPEVVCQSSAGGGITSSGGFSDFHPIPDWQKTAVADYFQKNLKDWQQPFPGFSLNTRGYPDVAVMGHNYLVYVGGKTEVEDGTSASAPVFAAMISLINAARFKRKTPLPPLGFLNIFLYKYAKNFQNDVTQGDNRCSVNSQTLVSGYGNTPVENLFAVGCCEQGFFAAPGWDPVTGLGSVNFTSLAYMLNGGRYLRRERERERVRQLSEGEAEDQGQGQGQGGTEGAGIGNEFKLTPKITDGFGIVDVLASNTATATATATASSAPDSSKKSNVNSPAQGLQQQQRQPTETANIASRDDLTLLQRASPQATHTVVLALAERRLDELEAVLQDVADPTSKEFGKHWSRQQIAEFTRLPADEQGRSAADRVVEILLAAGATKVTPSLHGEVIKATASVQTWERLLQAEFFEFSVRQRDGSVSTVTRCHQYVMPTSLQGLVSQVFKTVQFPMPYFLSPRARFGKSLGPLASFLRDAAASASSPRRGHSDVKGAGTGMGMGGIAPLEFDKEHLGGVNVTSLTMKGYVTPELLNTYYNVKSGDAQNFGQIGVFEGLNQTASELDLVSFQKLFHLPSQGIDVDVNGFVTKGNCTDMNLCDEANLDVQYMTAIVRNIKLWYLYSTDFMDGLQQLLLYLQNPPQVVSISYGITEMGVHSSDLEYFCQGAMKLGLMGITLVVSSGDDGAPGTATRAEGPPGIGPAACTYTAQFPASCPYVLAVGASMGPESGKTEVACQSDGGGMVTSGGGFSLHYKMPSWQVPALQSYTSQWQSTSSKKAPFPWAQPVEGFRSNLLINVMPPKVSVVGRAYPDVSMLGFNYLVVIANQVIPVSGTSASSPVFAAMIGLANARRLAKGKSTLGWITKALYSPLVANVGFLRDITYGSNKCGAFTPIETLPIGSSINMVTCCNQGYTAVPGWDPVTGLGGLKDFELFASYFELYTIEPTIMPTYTAAPPTQQPTESDLPSFLQPLSRLSGGAVFGILLAVLFPLAIAFSVAYMWWIGTLRNLSLASFKSWEAFSSLFHQPSDPLLPGQGGLDEIPNPMRSRSGQSATAQSFGSLRYEGADVEMRRSTGNSFAESRESSFIGSHSTPGNSGKRL